MSRDSLNINSQDARQLWAQLGEEGKAPPELTFASQVLPIYSVGIDPWIDRLAKTYFQELSRERAHFKLVIAPYGGGKTHFLMSLGSRALDEGFGVSYIGCKKGISLDNSTDIYCEFVKYLHLPGMDRPGLRNFLKRVVDFKMSQIEKANAPNPEEAFVYWLENLTQDEYPENAFSRVMAEALRGEQNPSRAVVRDAAVRWLRGEFDTLNKQELDILSLKRIQRNYMGEFGRDLLLSLIIFAKKHAGLWGIVLLFDEVETLFNAKGKALNRVLSAMRVMLDRPASMHGGVPLFGIFSAVPDILDELPRYGALDQRLAVQGAAFQEGNDFAPQLHLDQVASQENLLRSMGGKLVELGELATNYPFDVALQLRNTNVLARVATHLNLEINARRLFVKTWVNLLEIQFHRGEREFDEKELADRYRGYFDNLRNKEEADPEP
jgi:hypothetical protein